MIVQLSFNCIHIIKVVLDYKFIYTHTHTHTHTGISSIDTLLNNDYESGWASGSFWTLGRMSKSLL